MPTSPGRDRSIGPAINIPIGKPRWATPVAIIAALFLPLAIAPFVYLWHEKSGWQPYVTDVGGYEREKLADGSFAELNTITRLNVRLRPHERELNLTRGEALFEVAHDASRPFIVRVGNTRIRAVGTAFVVRVHGRDQVEVMVTQGVVAISHDSCPRCIFEVLPWYERSPNDALHVHAGEVAMDSMGQISISSLNPSELAARQSWRKGRITFSGQTLAEAAEEFNRYNSLRVVVADHAIAGHRIGGTFDATDVESFVKYWELSGNRVVWSVNASGERTVSLYGRADRRQADHGPERHGLEGHALEGHGTEGRPEQRPASPPSP